MWWFVINGVYEFLFIFLLIIMTKSVFCEITATLTFDNQMLFVPNLEQFPHAVSEILRCTYGQPENIMPSARPSIKKETRTTWELWVLTDNSAFYEVWACFSFLLWQAHILLLITFSLPILTFFSLLTNDVWILPSSPHFFEPLILQYVFPYTKKLHPLSSNHRMFSLVIDEPLIASFCFDTNFSRTDDKETFIISHIICRETHRDW